MDLATSAEQSRTRQATVIEGGDLACGELLMLVHEQIRGLPIGTLVDIGTTDPAGPLDIPAWCHLTGHRYHGPPPGASGRFRIEIAADRADVDPDKPWHRCADSHPTTSQENH